MRLLAASEASPCLNEATSALPPSPSTVLSSWPQRSPDRPGRFREASEFRLRLVGKHARGAAPSSALLWMLKCAGAALNPEWGRGRKEKKKKKSRDNKRGGGQARTEGSWISSHKVEGGGGSPHTEDEALLALNTSWSVLKELPDDQLPAQEPFIHQTDLKPPETQKVMMNTASAGVTEPNWGAAEASLASYSVLERSGLMNRSSGLLRSAVQVSFIPPPLLSLATAALTTPHRPVRSRKQARRGRPRQENQQRPGV